MFSVSSSLVAARRSQRRNILILRGMEGVQDARDIEDRGDVGTVVAVAQLRGIARFHRQIAARTRGQRLDDGGAVSIVQNERLLALRQAGRLQLGNPVEAFRVDLDGQAARQQRSRLRQLGRIGVVEAADGGQIAFQARTVQRGLIQVLRGAHECAGTPAHRAHQGSEIAARFRGEKHQHLLRALGHGHRQSVMRAFAGPGLAGEEPALGRRIGRAAQKCGHHQIMGGLGGRQIGFDPKAVAGDEIGNLGGRQGLRAAGDFDLEGGAGEIERRGFGLGRRG